MLSEKIDGMGLLRSSLPANIDMDDCGRVDETKLDTGTVACGNELIKRDQVAHMLSQEILGAADKVVCGHDVDLSGIFAEPARHDACVIRLLRRDKGLTGEILRGDGLFNREGIVCKHVDAPSIGGTQANVIVVADVGIA